MCTIHINNMRASRPDQAQQDVSATVKEKPKLMRNDNENVQKVYLGALSPRGGEKQVMAHLKERLQKENYVWKLIRVLVNSTL